MTHEQVAMRGTYRGVDWDLGPLLKSEIATNFVWSSEPRVPSEVQVRNLIDLADALRRLPPPKFDMYQYLSVDGGIYEEDRRIYGDQLNPGSARNIGRRGMAHVEECGTVCCAVGTAALLGIGDPGGCESWWDYTDRALCPSHNQEVWCFGGDWAWWDNTPEGAAARILYMLTRGIPETDIPDTPSMYSSMLHIQIGPAES